jgi:hypothetical protein
MNIQTSRYLLIAQQDTLGNAECLLGVERNGVHGPHMVHILDRRPVALESIPLLLCSRTPILILDRHAALDTAYRVALARSHHRDAAGEEFERAFALHRPGSEIPGVVDEEDSACEGKHECVAYEVGFVDSLG